MNINTIISNLGIVAIAFFAPIQSAMIAVGFLIGIDTIFGLLAAYKTKTKLKSRRFARVLVKMLTYQLLIISAHIAGVFLAPLIPFVNIVLTYIAISEFGSIGEKFTLITGKNFVKYLKDLMVKYINKEKKETE